MKKFFRFDLERFDETTTLKYYDANDSLHTIAYGNGSVTVDSEAKTLTSIEGNETSLAAGWYIVGDGEVTLSTLSASGDVHLIIPQNVTLGITTGDSYGISGDNATLNVYGAGTLDISSTDNRKIKVKQYNRYFDATVAASLTGNYDGNKTCHASIFGSSVNAGDEITNYGQDVVIKVFGGNDSVKNFGDSVSVYGGDGDDYITNYESSENNTIGTESIYTSVKGSNVLIDGGAGNDSISIGGGENISINAAVGANLISVKSGMAISVSGFGSDDSIQILDEDEDGNPVTVSLDSITAITGGIAAGGVTIYGLNEFSSTEGWNGDSDSGFVYSKNQTAGAKIDDGKKTIVYDSLNSEKSFTVTGMTATAGALVNVIADDGITDGVTLGSGNVGTSQLSISGGYNISLDNSVSISSSNAAYWSVASGDVYYTSDETLAGFSTPSGSVIPYVSATAATKFTIDGLKVPSLTDDSLVSGVSLGSSGEITLYSDAFSNLSNDTDDVTISLTGDGKYSLTLATSGDGSVNTSESVTVGTATGWSLLSGTEYAYYKPSYDAWYKSDSATKITRHASIAGDNFQANFHRTFDITDGEIDGIVVDSSDVSITSENVLDSLTSGKNATLTTGKGKFGFKLGSNVTSSASVIGAAWSSITSGKATYTSEYNRAYYSVFSNDQAISLSPESGKTQFEVDGLNSTLASVTSDAISVDGANVSVKAAALPTEKNKSLTLTNLNGAKYNFTTTEPTSAVSVSGTGEYNTGTKIYTATKWNAYYKPEDITNGKKFTYNASVGGETFTFSGLNQWSGVSVTLPYDANGKLTVASGSYGFTFGPDALKREDVSITSGTAFTVSLGSGVDSVGESISASKSLTGGLLTYQAAGTGEYYSAADWGVDYTAQSHGERFSLSGITNAEDVSVSGGTITVGENALDMDATKSYPVKLTRGDDTNYFSLTFDGVATSASSVGESLTVENSVGTYTSGYTPAYLNPVSVGTEYTFTPESGKTTLTISGLNDSASLDTNVTVDTSDNKVTLDKSALAPMDVSLSNNNYELILQDAAPVSVAAGWESIASGFAYNDSYVSVAGHTVDDTDKFKANYVAATNKTGLFSLSGSEASLTGDSLKGVDVSGDNTNGYTVELSTDALPKNLTVQKEITLTKGNVNSSLKLAEGINTLSTSVESAENLTNGKYTSTKYAEWYEEKLGDLKIICHPTTGGTELFTITGLASTASLNSNVKVNESGKSVSLSSGAFGTESLSVDNDYKIYLDGATKNSLVSAKWSVDGGDVSFVSDYNTGGFSVSSGSVIPYVSATAATKFTIDGLNVPSLTAGGTVDGVSLGSSGEITLYSDAFNNLNSATEDVTISLTGDEKYSLTLASGIDTAKSVSTAANWQPSSDDSINHVYTAAIYKPWFVLDDNRKKLLDTRRPAAKNFPSPPTKQSAPAQSPSTVLTSPSAKILCRRPTKNQSR